MVFGMKNSIKASNSIQKKLLLIAIIPVLLLSVAAVFTSWTSAQVLKQMNDLFTFNIYLKDLVKDVDEASASLNGYLTTKNSDDLRSYLRLTRVLSEKSAYLDTTLVNNTSEILERNIAVLLRRFINQGEAALSAKRGRNIPEYSYQYSNLEKTVAYLKDRVNTLLLVRLDSGLNTFNVFSLNLNRLQILNIVSILFLLLFGVSIIAYYSLKITDPIIHLALNAQRISKGDFSLEPIPLESNDEIGTLTNAFNVMKINIKEYIDEIKNKAEIESALKDEKLKNLEISTHLKNSELRALQARINPHFLFNTLNTCIQLTVIEDAERTRIFVENLAKLMRYSFRDLDAPVSLKDEVDSVMSYFYLLSIRFPHRYEFSCKIEEGANNTIIPKMILQPLVENAIVHGLKDREENAKVEIKAYCKDSATYIEVIDNGSGFSKEKIQEVFLASKNGLDYSGSESGIGLGSVIKRLELFTNTENPLQIEQSEAGGTVIKILLNAQAHREQKNRVLAE